jgi:hypothetical protein
MSFIALDVCGGRFGPFRKVFAASWEWFSMPCLATPAACRFPTMQPPSDGFHHARVFA